MKKITAGILTAVLVIALGGATVSAVGMGQAEIGRILKKNPNTVYTLLARARQLLKTKLEGVIDDE